jgi:hypothetical protein
VLIIAHAIWRAKDLLKHISIQRFAAEPEAFVAEIVSDLLIFVDRLRRFGWLPGFKVVIGR